MKCPDKIKKILFLNEKLYFIYIILYIIFYILNLEIVYFSLTIIICGILKKRERIPNRVKKIGKIFLDLTSGIFHVPQSSIFQQVEIIFEWIFLWWQEFFKILLFKVICNSSYYFIHVHEFYSMLLDIE